MSHLVVAEGDIRNISALKRAIDKIPGLRFNENKTAFDSYRSIDAFKANAKDRTPCMHSISLDDSAYEIGVIQHPDYPDSFKLVFDFWGAHGKKLKAAVGDGCNTLMARYCAEVESETADQLGYSVVVEEDDEYITQTLTQY